ncbi:MAG: hypothetical protein K6E27_09780 [Eubacterium sp.]|nr:hypothetical protein [Eubacterium sp.]
MLLGVLKKAFERKKKQHKWSENAENVAGGSEKVVWEEEKATHMKEKCRKCCRRF